MECNTVRKVDFEELQNLAVVGGSDNAATVQPDTTPIIATITVVSILSGIVSTVTEICDG